MYIFAENKKAKDMKVLVKEFLKEKGIQQKDLAARLGMTPSSFSKKIARANECDLNFLSKVAGALGVSVISLIEDERSVVVSSFQTEEGRFEVRKIR